MTRTALAAVTCTLLAACGTTIGSTTLATGHGGLLASTDGRNELGTTSASVGDSASQGSGDPATAAKPGTPRDAQLAPSGSDGPAASSLKLGRGIDATSINLGVTYAAGADSAFAALGVNVSIPDGHAYSEALINYINAHGGAAGRKIHPIYFKYTPAADASSSAAQDQSACAAFTQDHRVFAVTGSRLDSSGADDPTTSCLSKFDVLRLGGGGDEQIWRTFHHYQYDAAAVNETRVFRAMIATIVRQRLLHRDSKVGIVHWDSPAMARATEAGLVAPLKALGVPYLSVALKGDASYFSAMPNVVLKFRTEGVTNVLFGAPGGGAANQFMIQADNQHWKPKYGYGLSSLDSLTVLESASSKTQLSGSLGIGYIPFLDNSRGQAPNSAQQRCEKIFRDAGLAPSSNSDRWAQYTSCDTMALLVRGLNDASKSPDGLTSTGFEKAVSAVSSQFIPLSTFATRLEAGEHDGGAGYRTVHYSSACSCFEYFGPAVQRF